MFFKKFWFIIPSVKPPNSNSHLNNFIDNIVPRADYKDFLHPLQAIFMYTLIINWRLNLGLIFFEKLGTLIVVCPILTELSKLSFLYEMILTVIFNYFDV